MNILLDTDSDWLYAIFNAGRGRGVAMGEKEKARKALLVEAWTEDSSYCCNPCNLLHEIPRPLSRKVHEWHASMVLALPKCRAKVTRKKMIRRQGLAVLQKHAQDASGYSLPCDALRGCCQRPGHQPGPAKRHTGLLPSRHEATLQHAAESMKNASAVDINKADMKMMRSCRFRNWLFGRLSAYLDLMKRLGNPALFELRIHVQVLVIVHMGWYPKP